MKTGAAFSFTMSTCCQRTTTTLTPATSSFPHTCLWPWTSLDTGRRAQRKSVWNSLSHCNDSVVCDPLRLPYPQYFGGVSAVTPDQYMKMNGFPNQYWGWGGEDDDIAAR